MKKIFVCAFGAFLMVGSLAGFSGCGEKAAVRPHYSISGEYFPDRQTLKAEMSVTVPNLADAALDHLSFELWANAYRKGAKFSPVSELYREAAYYGGESYGGISVSALEGADSFEVCGEDENILSVKLSEPLSQGESVTIGMDFEVTLANVNHRLGVGEHNVNLANFYPVLCARGEEGFLEYVYAQNGDPFVSDCADYEVELTFPSDYEVAFGGEGTVEMGAGKKTLKSKTEGARDVAFVLGKDLKKSETQAAGKTVEYFYFEDEKPETALKAAADSLNCFSELFGEYLYPKYTVVETDFPYGGMEYSALGMISSGLEQGDVPAVVAHETAHQWWYSMVGSNQFENAWLDEGLAEYSAALFLEAHPEYGVSYQELVRRSENGYRAYFSVKSQISKDQDTNMNRPLTSYSGEYEYRNLAYDKGVILFDRVRSVTGDKKFFSGLKRYCSDYTGKIATPEDLMSCLRPAKELILSFVDGKCVI